MKVASDSLGIRSVIRGLRAIPRSFFRSLLLNDCELMDVQKERKKK